MTDVSYEFSIKVNPSGEGGGLAVTGYRSTLTPRTGGRSAQRTFRAYLSREFWELVLLPALVAKFGPRLKIFDADSRLQLDPQQLLASVGSSSSVQIRTERGLESTNGAGNVSQGAPAPVERS